MPDLIPEIVASALSRVDRRGRFTPADHRVLRARITPAVSGDRSAIGLPLDHPVELFGPWHDLGETAQTTLREAVERDITGTMRFYPRGSLWNGLIRRCWELDRDLVERRRFPWLRGQAIAVANRLSGAPINLRARAQLALGARRWHAGGQCGVTELLAALGKTPHWLCGDFVEGVRVDPRAAGFHVDTHRHVTVGSHIGMDLMPTAEGMICLEANLQVGFLKRRRELQPHNPTGNGIIAAARAVGATHVLWMEGHRIPLQEWFMHTLGELGAPHGISTEFRQDPRMPRRRDLSTARVPDPARSSWELRPPANTLLVRRNEFRVGPDYVINDKEPFVRAMAPILNAPDAMSPVSVLPQTREPVVPAESFAHGLPNLVYKYPDGLSGNGVFFLRARTVEDARRLAREIDARTGEAPGLFQRFVPSQLTETGAVHDVRAEIFITPHGTHFLGAFRRTAALPMPAAVPEGVVDTPGALTSNMSRGGSIDAISDVEMAAVERAAIAVGDALRMALSRTFDDGRPRADRRDPGAREALQAPASAQAIG